MFKVLLLLCKSRYRKDTLNNFSRSAIYENILVLSFCGPILFFIGKYIQKLKIIKCISIDGEPLISNVENGINIWFGGTSAKIPLEYKNLNNNYVNMKSVFERNKNTEKVFQIHPIISKKEIFKKSKKIVLISSLRSDFCYETLDFWKKNKKNFLKNLSIFNTTNIFSKYNTDNVFNQIKIFKIFREIQSLLRIEIVKKIYPIFKKQIIIIGKDWNVPLKKKTINLFEKKKREELYNNNICLDLGSNSGSLSLYPRSIEIIENNGALIQLEQQDSEFIFHDFKDIFTFRNFENLIKKLKYLIDSRSNFDEHINLQQSFFKNSKNKIFNEIKNSIFYNDKS
jgi:hypothetical protein